MGSASLRVQVRSVPKLRTVVWSKVSHSSPRNMGLPGNVPREIVQQFTESRQRGNFPSYGYPALTTVNVHEKTINSREENMASLRGSESSRKVATAINASSTCRKETKPLSWMLLKRISPCLVVAH